MGQIPLEFNLYQKIMKISYITDFYYFLEIYHVDRGSNKREHISIFLYFWDFPMIAVNRIRGSLLLLLLLTAAPTTGAHAEKLCAPFSNGKVKHALRRGRQRNGSDDAVPVEMADTTTIPETGSKRMPMRFFSGCGFLQAHSQLTQGPPSATRTRVWSEPQSGLSCSCGARTG